MGAEYMPVYKTFDFTNSSDRDKIDIVKTKFNEYFEPKKLICNTILYKRASFNSECSLATPDRVNFNSILGYFLILLMTYILYNNNI